MVDEAGLGNGEEEKDDRCSHVRGEIRELRLVDTGLAKDFDGSDETDERNVFLEADEIVHQRWHDAPDGLGEDDEPHGLTR